MDEVVVICCSTFLFGLFRGFCSSQGFVDPQRGVPLLILNMAATRQRDVIQLVASDAKLSLESLLYACKAAVGITVLVSVAVLRRK